MGEVNVNQEKSIYIWKDSRMSLRKPFSEEQSVVLH